MIAKFAAAPISSRGECVDEAKINRVVSATYLEGVINSPCIALDYAYWVHRWDQYRYTSGEAYLYPYGYGYGYGNNGYYPAGFTGGYMRRY